MKCPVDSTDLVMSERQNVEIDYCPQCRGVWLDRGELDKIIEKVESAAPQPSAPRQNVSQDEKRHLEDNRHYDEREKYYAHKKKRSGLDFFGELFD